MAPPKPRPAVRSIPRAADADQHPLQAAKPELTVAPDPPAASGPIAPPEPTPTPPPTTAPEPEQSAAPKINPSSGRVIRMQWSTRISQATVEMVDRFMQDLPITERRGVIQELTDRGLRLAIAEKLAEQS